MGQLDFCFKPHMNHDLHWYLFQHQDKHHCILDNDNKSRIIGYVTVVYRLRQLIHDFVNAAIANTFFSNHDTNIKRKVFIANNAGFYFWWGFRGLPCIFNHYLLLILAIFFRTQRILYSAGCALYLLGVLWFQLVFYSGGSIS